MLIMENVPISGLPTQEALKRLNDDIASFLAFKCKERKKSDFKSFFLETISLKTVESAVPWTSMLIALYCFVILLVASIITDVSFNFWTFFDGVLIVTLTVVNILFNMWDNKLKSDEIYKRAEFILHEIKETLNGTVWNTDNYPPLYTPISPCITLQWVYRDGHLVNLPWTLLVSGDTILIRPGQVIPGDCVISNDKYADVVPQELKYGETYAPISDSSTIGQLICRKPNACKPVENIAYVLTETPYIRNLRTVINDHPNRPVTVFERKRRQLLVTFVQLILLPAVLVMIYIINFIRWVNAEVNDLFVNWIELFLTQPVTIVLPLLPLGYPAFWLILNCLGNSLLLSTPNTEVKKSIKDSDEEIKFQLNWSRIFGKLSRNITGKSHDLTRSSNLLYILGSLTGLCFVDKEGTLSWPNPSADAICFLKKPDKVDDEGKGESNEEEEDGEGEEESANEENVDEGIVDEENENEENEDEENEDEENLDDDCLESTEATPFLEKPPKNTSIIISKNSEDKAKRPSHNVASKEDEQPVGRPEQPTSSGRAPLLKELSKSRLISQIMSTSFAEILSDSKSTKKNSPESNENVELSDINRAQSCEAQIPPENDESLSEAAGNEEAKTDTSQKSPNFVREILDISHDKSCDFSLQFDDSTWARYLSSLKPLGLAILLNTCNPATIENYSKFASHVSCQAHHYNQNKLTFFDRRCLCEIPKQIGFAEDKVLAQFKIISQIFIYKHVRERFLFRTYKSTKVKSKLSGEMRLVPFPHLVSTVYEKYGTDEVQMMSQGTFDVVLDGCVDYFDGKTVHPLTKAERKSLESFYKHAFATGYCTVFSFRAVAAPIPKEFAETYLEIPCFAHNLYEKPHWNLSDSCSNVANHYCSSDNIGAAQKKLKPVHPSDVNRCFRQNCNQIFLGMVSMQYQALEDIVQLIEGIEKACIRFIFFSVENAQRAGPFHEKLGKEAAGWNCHISLENEKKESNGTFDSLKQSASIGLNHPSFHGDSVQLHQLTPRSLRRIRKLSRSLSASATFPEISVLRIHVPTEDKNSSDDSCDERTYDPQTRFQSDKAANEAIVFSDVDKCLTSNRSLSCASDDSGEPAPPDYALPNISKLPVGIENVRDHLERVDNVPLLISLFVDCTAENTREMLLIRQEYSEVDCVLGSSANAKNAGVFVQANASIAVEPMYPQLCQKVPLMRDVEDGYSPCALSSLMNSLPCALYLRCEDLAFIYNFIMEARNFTLRSLGVFQFWILCCTAASLIQIVTALINLPNPFGVGQILYLSCFLIPFLSVSLIIGTANPEIMQRPIGKNKFTCNFEGATYIMKCYGTKLIPLITILPLIYFLSLNSLSSHILSHQCSNVTTVQCSSENWSGWTNYPETFSSLQRATFLLLVIHFVATSISFIDRENLIWHKLPRVNLIWFSTATLLVFFQVIYSVILDLMTEEMTQTTVMDLPLDLLYLALLSPIVTLVFNETVSKYIEIDENTRIRRKIKLEFNTKLGMNSPF